MDQRLQTMLRGLSFRSPHAAQARWEEENTISVDEGGNAVTSLDDLMGTLPGYELPAHILPLARERYPFARLSANAIEQVVVRALSDPTAKGRLSDAVRRRAGFTRVRPDKFVVVEAHIDLTSVDNDLFQQLVLLGFEPDNFAKIQPEQYLNHFTLQHVCGTAMTHKSNIVRDVERRARAASELLATSYLQEAYVETELYTYRHVLPFIGQSKGPGPDFPFSARDFVVKPVFITDDHIVDPNFDSIEKRAADVHVKVGSSVCSHEEALASTNPLGDLFLAAGFYEIISEGGSRMYSAHFADYWESCAVVNRLALYAAQCDETCTIVHEICTGLWRSVRQLEGKAVRAELPPHLRLSDFSIIF